MTAVAGFRTGNRLKEALRRGARRAGFDVRRFNSANSPEARRELLLRTYDIDTVLDVGANDGGYAADLRRLGFRGRIVSFEPLPDAFAILERRARTDALWDCHAVALGDRAETMDIHVAANSQSSSLLPMREEHTAAAPESRYIGAQTVEVRDLDGLRAGVGLGERNWMKLDVQGYELKALAGAEATLRRVSIVETEVSLAPLYEGQPGFRSLLDHLEQRGFGLVGAQSGFTDPQTGRTLQIDATFARAD